MPNILIYIKEVQIMEEVYEFLKNAGTYYLATLEGDQARVRPFGTVNVYDGKLYIQTGKKKDVAKQLESKPKAEICAMYNGSWIRVRGTLVEDDSLEAQQAMLDSYPNLQANYRAGDGNTLVLYFKDAVATISSFTAAPKTIEF